MPVEVLNQAIGEHYALYHGDSVELLPGLPDESVDLIVTSPPFGAKLYVYNPSERDLSNSRDEDEFLQHFAFIIRELYRVTKPGRVAACHVMDVPAMLVRDGYIGLKDFSGEIVREFLRNGWIFDARIPIDKNQQAQAIRTHSSGLTKATLERDATRLRPALPDYLLKFRKPGQNVVPVVGNIDMNTWIEWASPTWPAENGDRCRDAGAFATWYGIRETETLNVAIAREADDENHLCPLAFGTVERCIKLWSNPEETVFDPFSGVGTVTYQAVRFGRRGLGFELKRSYFDQSCRYVRQAEAELHSMTLFDLLPTEQAA